MNSKNSLNGQRFKRLVQASIITILFALLLLTESGGAITYYVDSSTPHGRTYFDAQNPLTPVSSVNEIIQTCSLQPGDIVKIQGRFSSPIAPNSSGSVVKQVEDLALASGSTITFTTSTNLSSVNPDSDWLCIYGSRKGNSGAFSISSVNASLKIVVVDTSDLPGSSFVTETSSDPGILQGTIIRPIQFIAWDKDNPPVWDSSRIYFSGNNQVILLSYLNSTYGETVQNFAAIKLDGGTGGDASYTIMDHLDIRYAECSVFTEWHDFKANYCIIQHCYFHDTGFKGGSPCGASDEIIYWGMDGKPSWHTDYVQIMYNKLGPSRYETVNNAPPQYPCPPGNPDFFIGSGIEVKPSSHYPTIWGNEIFNLYTVYSENEAAITVYGANAFVSNNYIHDINPINVGACGIGIVGGGSTIVCNNIIENVKYKGIANSQINDVGIYNNTIYNITGSGSYGIYFLTYSGECTGQVVKNNIIHSADIGMGRNPYYKSYSFEITNDYNMVYNCIEPFGDSISQGAHDSISNPQLIDPTNADFTINIHSPACDVGTSLSKFFQVDFQDAADPTITSIEKPIVRFSNWDIGAFEYMESDDNPPGPPSAPTGLRISQN